MLKYQLGQEFIAKERFSIRDGIVEKGIGAFIEEINEDEHEADGTPTPYRLFVEKTVDKFRETVVDGDEVGGTDWFSEEEIEKLFTEKKRDSYEKDK